MDPQGEQRSKPRKRDRIKKFYKDPFSSRTGSSSSSRTTSHPTVAGGPGTSFQTRHDVTAPTPLAENIPHSEIQSDQDNINTATEIIPAQNEENTFIPFTSTSGQNGAWQVSSPIPPSGPLEMSRGEGEVHGTTAGFENPIQDHGAAIVEGNPPDLSSPAQANIPATVASHTANEPQEGTAPVALQPARATGKIYKGVKTTLQKIVQVSDVFPPLKSVAAGLLVICNTIDGYGKNKEEFNELLKRMEVLSKIMVSCPPDVLQEVKDCFDGLLRTLEEKQKILQAKVDPTRSGVERAILAMQDKQEVSKLTQEVRFAIEIAMFDAIIENRAQTFWIVSGVDWLKEQFNGASVLVTSTSTSHAWASIVIEDHTKTMHSMKRTIQSLKRFNTLQKLGRVEGTEYSNAKRGPSGLAEKGKTTVSKTFCSQLNNRGLLSASFFCTLKELDKMDVYLIIPTLARILAEKRPQFGDALEEILESCDSCRNPTEMELKDQYLKLILLPAEKTFTADELLVLGVDALDECNDQNAVGDFIAAIVSQKPTIALKFFLTSRPKISLWESFESSTHHGWLRLHDIEADIVKADILLYLNDQFKSNPRVYSHYRANWPPPEIQTIANVSGTLFIIAATMVSYVATYSGNRLKRFQEPGQPSANVQLSGIEALYSRILAEAFTDLEQEAADMIRFRL
ncbi:hypothetical protein EST38_g12443 [Candolleomyces aberdarensis]|uniref:Nephrocystin 3-like N-terminal domain-containing protein n=1 Tax=Candolleomyces aberdarensis TaxID=2316362 RepID=A0A4Q2D4M6_9AGAR|nr:hypothetical protein EST38_g12443 [Candolleomyces aberdarensis]